MCKIEKSGRGRPGRGGGFGNSDTPGQGEGGGLKFRDFGGRPPKSRIFKPLLSPCPGVSEFPKFIAQFLFFIV